jgi:hypothetical protein
MRPSEAGDAASDGSGSEKPQSGYALCGVFLRHIFARRNALWAGKTSYTAETLCAIPPKILFHFFKIINKI